MDKFSNLPTLNYHLTLKSRNGKTGPIPVSTTAKGSCPDCPMSEACYAAVGPLAMFWQKVSAGRTGTDFETFLGGVSALPFEQLWRHNQAGDLPGEHNAIDVPALMALVAANRGKRGFTYTHKPVLGADPAVSANRAAIAAANRDGFTINLSGNSPAHADELAGLGIAPVVTVLPIEYGRREKAGKWIETLEEYRVRTAHLPKVTPAGRPISVCPATFLDTNCKGCKGLCQKQNRASVVGFPAHSQNAAKADAIARAA
jgi:hypothetical protein